MLVDKAGTVRTPITAAQLLAAVREKKRVELAAGSLPLSQPLSSLGEHVLPLVFDARYVKGKHSLTVLVKKKL